MSEGVSDVLVVTGVSGAGKSAAAAVLEDLGWFVVDNLPPSMLPDLVEAVGRSGDASTSVRLAVGVDVRGGGLFADLEGALRAVREQGLRPEGALPRGG